MRSYPLIRTAPRCDPSPRNSPGESVPDRIEPLGLSRLMAERCLYALPKHFSSAIKRAASGDAVHPPAEWSLLPSRVSGNHDTARGPDGPCSVATRSPGRRPRPVRHGSNYTVHRTVPARTSAAFVTAHTWPSTTSL